MTSQQILLFLSLAETLSFTKTADIMHVAQSVVSRQISALENELGFPLLSRDRHHVALTAAGDIMKSCFERALGELNSAKEKAARSMTEACAPISIRLLTYLDINSLINAINKFTDSSFYIESHDAPCPISDLLIGKYDVAVTFEDKISEFRKENIQYREVLKGRDYFLYSPLLARHGDLSPENMPVCLVSDDMITPANFPSVRMKSCGLEKRRIQLAPNMTSVLKNVETGLSATILKEFSLPYLHFEHKAIPLDSWQSVGIVWLSDNPHPHLPQFLYSCFP